MTKANLENQWPFWETEIPKLDFLKTKLDNSTVIKRNGMSF